MSESKRVSNRQILDALTDLPTQIAAAIAATQTAAPKTVAVAEATEQTPTDKTVEVDKAYVEHMTLNKCQPFADKHGEDCVLYARKNGRNETKLAYCLASKFAGLKDRGLIGAVAMVSPTS